jgi:hypothetical protein
LSEATTQPALKVLPRRSEQSPTATDNAVLK